LGGFRTPPPSARCARRASRACPAHKVYPNHRTGHILFIAGALMLFVFAPFWVWVVGLGAALVFAGLCFMNKE